jgi:threonyl-tRNA synthetase
MQEVENRNVSTRRLGENQTHVVPLEQALASLQVEALAPDLV